MAISERDFYAAHGLDMSPDKLLQEYTKYTSAKMLEVVKEEIASVSFVDKTLFPHPIKNKLILIGCMKGLQVAQAIIDKHISDLTSEVAANEENTTGTGKESSKDI